MAGFYPVSIADGTGFALSLQKRGF